MDQNSTFAILHNNNKQQQQTTIIPWYHYSFQKLMVLKGMLCQNFDGILGKTGLELY